MELAREIVRVLCLTAAVIDAFVAYYQTKQGRYDKAAYWMAFGVFMLAVRL